MVGDLLTRAALAARLAANGLRYGVLELQGGAAALVLERGGRVLGPFLDAQSGPLFWLSPALRDDAGFVRFLAAGEWNTGGDRTWIAPEIQFSVADRRDFWGTIALPPQMDPGAWALDEPEPGVWRLRQSLTLDAHNLATGEKSLAVERLLRAAPDPLASTRNYRTLVDGVTYSGYEQEVTLRETQRDAILSQGWNVVQLPPGGRVLVPATPDAEVTDYMELLDGEHLARSPHWLSFRLTGRRRYKAGVRAAHHFGRLAYLHPGEDGHAWLAVRSFFNNPSRPYAEEPPDRPGAHGDSIHVYNDGGAFGGFGEMECHGQTIGGATGISASTDTLSLWLYAGPPQRIAAIARALLGVETSAAWA
jgi:hypothetical protein